MSVPSRRTGRPATGDLDPCGQERPRSHLNKPTPTIARTEPRRDRLRFRAVGEAELDGAGPTRGRALAGPLQFRLAQPGRQRGQRQQPGQRLGPQRAVPGTAHARSARRGGRSAGPSPPSAARPARQQGGELRAGFPPGARDEQRVDSPLEVVAGLRRQGVRPAPGDLEHGRELRLVQVCRTVS